MGCLNKSMIVYTGLGHIFHAWLNFLIACAIIQLDTTKKLSWWRALTCDHAVSVLTAIA